MTDRLWPLYSEAELAEVPEPSWLIDGHVTDGFTVVYGPPKAGKTFLALSWALAIGAGVAWQGHQVNKGPVVYVSGEGVGGLHRRVQGWKAAEYVTASQLYVIPAGVRFGSDRQHAVALRNDLHATGAKLLVVDTLARSMAGADENSAQDMGQHVQALDWLREKTGCAVMLLHHSGVAGDRPRGSSSLFGAADTLVRVDGDGRMVNVTCEGQKDSAPFRKRTFELKQAGPSVSLHEVSAVQSGFSAASY